MIERDEATYRVDELISALGATLGDAFPTDIWVQGRIQNLNRSTIGHVYFDLVDGPTEGEDAVRASVTAQARISVALLATTKRVVNAQLKRAGGMRMTDDTEVRIRAMVEVYPPLGRLQLRMTGIDPTYTIGRLAEQRELLVRQLAEEGLLDRNASVRLSPVPLRVGLVTSVGSAAYNDFLDELRRSRFAWQVSVVDTRVQGHEASQGVVHGLETLAARPLDVIALVRGGGARTDLATFDQAPLARAVATCPLPVLTGVGHETDSTVADAVAHTALKTPTACAGELVGLVRAFRDGLDQRWSLLHTSISRQLDRASGALERDARSILSTTRSGLALGHQRLTADTDRLARATTVSLEQRHESLRSAARQLDNDVVRAVSVSRHRLDAVTTQLASACQRELRVDGQRLAILQERLVDRSARSLPRHLDRLDQIDARVRALDPARLLARGWSITRDGDGHLVRSVDDVSSGERVTVQLSDGMLESTVDAVSNQSSEVAETPRA